MARCFSMKPLNSSTENEILFRLHLNILVRLLEFQNSGYFNFYMFNNTEGGVNGFVRVNDQEKAL